MRRGRGWVARGAALAVASLTLILAGWASRGHHHGRRVEAGERPSFPIGLYYVPRLRYREIQDLGFNFVHLWALPDGSTEQGLDESARLGLRAVIELSDAWRDMTPDLERLARYVRVYRDHKALLAWYLVDEPKRDPRSVRAVAQAYRLVKTLDPAHPVLVVLISPDRDRVFAPYLDILAVDPYPVPNLPLGIVFRYVESSGILVGWQKPVWAVVQAHAKPDPGRMPSRYPTPVELRNMVYQSLVGRASGLMYFSFEWNGVTLDVGDPTLYRFLRSVNAEVQRLSEVLASGLEVDVRVSAVGGAGIRVRALEQAGRTYVLTVNVENRPTRVRLSLGSPGPDEVTRLFEDGTVRLSAGSLDDELPPYGVRVYLR